MLLSKEQFEFFYNQIKDESREASELLGNTRVIILEDVESILKGSDVQTVQDDPNTSTGRNPKFSVSQWPEFLDIIDENFVISKDRMKEELLLHGARVACEWRKKINELETQLADYKKENAALKEPKYITVESVTDELNKLQKENAALKVKNEYLQSQCFGFSNKYKTSSKIIKDLREWCEALKEKSYTICVGHDEPTLIAMFENKLKELCGEC